ncbi:hypothetical protein ACKLTP_18935, partial [Paenarthrobacter ureafaciens]|uniref:hypothetical protein n=1 Tax=Paenarthrobacter ureafaciens TaxID=37931 RepID=UPI00397E3AB6
YVIAAEGSGHVAIVDPGPEDEDEEQQDQVLVALSGAPKPIKVTLGTKEPVTTFLQGSFDENLPFFDTLCLHTRQGFYGEVTDAILAQAREAAET